MNNNKLAIINNNTLILYREVKKKFKNMCYENWSWKKMCRYSAKNHVNWVC